MGAPVPNTPGLRYGSRASRIVVTTTPISDVRTISKTHVFQTRMLHDGSRDVGGTNVQHRYFRSKSMSLLTKPASIPMNCIFPFTDSIAFALHENNGTGAGDQMPFLGNSGLSVDERYSRLVSYPF